MNIERFVAKDMRSALKLIKAALGNDAVIYQSRNIDGGVEIEASAGEIAAEESNAVVASIAAAEAVSAIPAPTQPAQIMAEVNHDIKTTQSALNHMRHEMSLLRKLLEDKQVAQAPVSNPYQHGFQRLVYNRFQQLGLQPKLSQAIIEECDLRAEFDDYWLQAIQLLACQIPVDQTDPIKEGGRFAFVGPTGIGKTTTVAKLATRFVMESGTDDIALITTDCYRVAGREQLSIYGQILNVPVSTVRDEAGLTRALDKFSDKHLVLIDTAGISQRDIHIAERLALFENEKNRLKNYIVLSATSNQTIIEESIERFGQLPLIGAILTKLDEATELGNLINLFIQHKLHLDYVSVGQRVPQDIQLANGQMLVDKMLEIEHPHHQWLNNIINADNTFQGAVNAC